MVTFSPLHAGPAFGFDEPFEMLHACHARVRRTLELLQRLGGHLGRHGSDAAARNAASDVLRYFDIAAPLHHEDEERHVLPCLRGGSDSALRALADALQAEHVHMDALWDAIRSDLLAVHGGIAPGAEALEAACSRWAAFASLYAGHIETEERRAYPAAHSGLDAEALRRMGRDMARRRGARDPFGRP